jgi:signal transduction histidine kinase
LLIYELRPPILQQEGLAAALEARIEIVEQRAGLGAELIIEGVDRLPENVEHELYSIAIEALNNALKHAQAEKIVVSLLQRGTLVKMKIQDDGLGFDQVAALESGGLGLISMQERVSQLGAQFKISSEPGKGTLLEVELELEG